jgi:hypothetical protein
MAGRSRSHSEERWALLPETIVRCNAMRPNGGHCRREAVLGAVVCDQHGGAAPQVRRRAAERLIMTADHAAQMLVNMMADPEVPFGVRAKIAQDLLDRAGLVAAQVHKIVPMTDDPVIAFFEGLLSDPSNWEENPPPPAIEERAIDPDAELVEAEIVEPEGEPANDTPLRVPEMIKSGAFDRKPGE